MPDFVTLGETSAVFVAKKIGRMRYSGEYEIRPGGAEATVAVGVLRLGHSAGWISRLGNDELGHYLLSFIRGEGVDISRVDMSETAQTALFLRERLPGGRARHFYYRSGSAFTTLTEDDLDETYIAGAKVLHLTGITTALSDSCVRLVHRAITVARRNKVLVTFDPNMRKRLWTSQKAREILEPIFPLADYILPGIEDMEAVCGRAMKEQEVLDYLHGLGCGSVILKLGDRGALVSHAGDRSEYVECAKIADPVDLMGAGDAFASGFITGLLEGMRGRDAADLGNAVAGISIRAPGNIESLPTRKELEAAREGKPGVER
jgi:2-dehydro-3-deoxygluconokinase